MNNLGERPEEVRAVLAAVDPRFVKLQLDTAHYQQGGGDPVAAVKEYKDRLLFLHIKDLQAQTPVPGATGEQAQQVSVRRAGTRESESERCLRRARCRSAFKGWAVVELDRVPDDARTPKESAIICKKYVESLG